MCNMCVYVFFVVVGFDENRRVDEWEKTYENYNRTTFDSPVFLIVVLLEVRGMFVFVIT